MLSHKHLLTVIVCEQKTVFMARDYRPLRYAQVGCRVDRTILRDKRSELVGGGYALRLTPLSDSRAHCNARGGARSTSVSGDGASSSHSEPSSSSFCSRATWVPAAGVRGGGCGAAVGSVATRFELSGACPSIG